MTWTRRLHAGAVALVLMGGCGALGARMLGGADPVSVDEAVQRFRGSTPASPSTDGGRDRPAPSGGPGASPANGAPAGSAGSAGSTGGTTTPAPTATAVAPRGGEATRETMPPEGVYVFATTGYETGDAGPAHARHDYPEETTSTIRYDACGYHMRWEPNEDRWDDVRACVEGDTVTIKTYDTMHAFFGVKERHTYQCGPNAYFRPPSTKPGYAWQFDCDSGRAQTHTRAHVVGIENGALHVRFDTAMTGATEGSNPSDYWLALDGPYLLRKTGRVDAKVHTDFGTLDYHEEYDVRLTSRQPRT